MIYIVIRTTLKNIMKTIEEIAIDLYISAKNVNNGNSAITIVEALNQAVKLHREVYPSRTEFVEKAEETKNKNKVR